MANSASSVMASVAPAGACGDLDALQGKDVVTGSAHLMSFIGGPRPLAVERG